MSRILKLFLICILPLNAFALQNDAKETVHITASSATYNYKTGVDVYEGNVKVDQGTTHITADRLVTKKNSEHKIAEAIAYGNRRSAHFWTLPNQDEPEIHAHAKIIKFYPIKSDAMLEKNVLVTQGSNSFTGEIVQYNNSEQTITVPASKNSHAVIVYNPDKANLNDQRLKG
jgi:lipopolysaccharide export system protein LptA